MSNRKLLTFEDIPELPSPHPEECRKERALLIGLAANQFDWKKKKKDRSEHSTHYVCTGPGKNIKDARIYDDLIAKCKKLKIVEKEYDRHSRRYDHGSRNSDIVAVDYDLIAALDERYKPIPIHRRLCNYFLPSKEKPIEEAAQLPWQLREGQFRYFIPIMEVRDHDKALIKECIKCDLIGRQVIGTKSVYLPKGPLITKLVAMHPISSPNNIPDIDPPRRSAIELINKGNLKPTSRDL